MERILVRGPNWLGDLVMATGSFADLKASFPEARIDFLLPRSRRGVLAGASYFGEFIADPGRSPREILRVAGEVRARRYDLAVVYPNSLRSALIPFLAGIPRRAGYAGNWRRWLLTTALKEPYGRPKQKPGPRMFPYPMPERYAQLIRAAGAAPGDGRPRIAVDAECEERARAWRRSKGIADGERLIGINPGAAFGASKLWPLDRFSALADALVEKTGRRAIVFVGPGEEAIGREIESRMRQKPVTTHDAPLGLDLMKPVVRDLALLVTTDTGTRQYAVAFRVPILVVMGPTHPGFSNANLDETVVVRRDVPCGPCHLKICPIDHRCMTEISVEEMLSRALELLQRFPR